MNLIQLHAQLTLRGLIGDPANFDITHLKPIILAVTDTMVAISGTVALLYLIIGGIQYLTSAGEEKSIQKSKETLTWAVIGLLVILFAFAFVTFFANLFIQ